MLIMETIKKVHFAHAEDRRFKRELKRALSIAKANPKDLVSSEEFMDALSSKKLINLEGNRDFIINMPFATQLNMAVKNGGLNLEAFQNLFMEDTLYNKCVNGICSILACFLDDKSAKVISWHGKAIGFIAMNPSRVKRGINGCCKLERPFAPTYWFLGMDEPTWTSGITEFLYIKGDNLRVTEECKRLLKSWKGYVRCGDIIFRI